MATSERAVEEVLKRKAAEHNVLPLKFVSPGVRGVPDRILLSKPTCPHCQEGRAAFVELKRPVGGHLSVIQRRVHTAIRSLGFKVGVVTHSDDVDTFLEEWLR
jgi:hypothetical protein